MEDMHPFDTLGVRDSAWLLAPGQWTPSTHRARITHKVRGLWAQIRVFAEDLVTYLQ